MTLLKRFFIDADWYPAFVRWWLRDWHPCYWTASVVDEFYADLDEDLADVYEYNIDDSAFISPGCRL